MRPNDASASRIGPKWLLRLLRKRYESVNVQTLPPLPHHSPSPGPSAPQPHLFGIVAASVLCFGLILAATVIAGAWTRISETEVISVTGSAHRNVRADVAIWRASFSAEADGLLEAHKRLNNDLGKVVAFLQSNAIRDYTVSPVQIREITTRSDNNSDSVPVTIGFRLSRNVEVHSYDVDVLPRLSSETNELLQQGVAFATQSMSFIYTKANEARVDMIAEATKDARARADQIAIQGRRKIRRLRSAKVAPLQINPQFSSPVGMEATNDITSADKTITTTVAVTFDLR